MEWKAAMDPGRGGGRGLQPCAGSPHGHGISAASRRKQRRRRLEGADVGGLDHGRGAGHRTIAGGGPLLEEEAIIQYAEKISDAADFHGIDGRTPWMLGGADHGRGAWIPLAFGRRGRLLGLRDAVRIGDDPWAGGRSRSRPRWKLESRLEIGREEARSLGCSPREEWDHGKEGDVRDDWDVLESRCSRTDVGEMRMLHGHGRLIRSRLAAEKMDGCDGNVDHGRGLGFPMVWLAQCGESLGGKCARPDHGRIGPAQSVPNAHLNFNL